MFSTIVVPLDGTPEAAVALPLARALAAPGRAELNLLRVVPSLANADQAGQARAYLERVSRELGEGAIRVSGQVREGDVLEAIMGAVEENGAELVVMATHGRAGLARALLGSVTQQVLEHSPVPTVLVRPGGHRTTRLRTLLVPLDGTEGGALAIGRAAELARASGARLVVLQVVAPIPAWLFAAEFGAASSIPVDLSWEDEALRAALDYVSEVAARLTGQGVAAEGRALIGEVAPTVAAVADEVEADLIVMASRGLTGAARTLLGSTADAVVRSSRHPVLLVRRRGAPNGTPVRPPAASTSRSP